MCSRSLSDRGHAGPSAPPSPRDYIGLVRDGRRRRRSTRVMPLSATSLPPVPSYLLSPPLLAVVCRMRSSTSAKVGLQVVRRRSPSSVSDAAIQRSQWSQNSRPQRPITAGGNVGVTSASEDCLFGASATMARPRVVMDVQSTTGSLALAMVKGVREPRPHSPTPVHHR